MAETCGPGHPRPAGHADWEGARVGQERVLARASRSGLVVEVAARLPLQLHTCRPSPDGLISPGACRLTRRLSPHPQLHEPASASHRDVSLIN